MAGALVGGGDLSTGVKVATGAPVDFTDGKDQGAGTNRPDHPQWLLFAARNGDGRGPHAACAWRYAHAQALPALTQWTVSKGRSRDLNPRQHHFSGLPTTRPSAQRSGFKIGHSTGSPFPIPYDL